MNAIPAEADVAQGEPGQEQQPQEQDQGQEAGHLTAIVGGRGRPSKEVVEAKRAETREKLERWGLFEAAKNRRSKSFDTWGVSDCESALAWAQKQITKNGSVDDIPEEPGESVEPEPVMCDCCGVVPPERFGLGYARCQECIDLMERFRTQIVRGEGPWLDPSIVFSIFHPIQLSDPECGEWWGLEIARAWDGFRGILGAFRILNATVRAQEARFQTYVRETERRIRTLEGDNRKLERELGEAFGDIQRLTSDREYKASLKDIMVVAGIDRGRFVRDLKKKLQQVVNDAVGRDDPGYKGKVKAVLTITFDKSQGRPTESKAAIITCEVNEDTPPAVSGSRLYFDGEGEIVPPQEAIEQMPLMQAGASQAQA